MGSVGRNSLVPTLIIHIFLLTTFMELGDCKKRIVTTKVVTDVVTRPISKPFYENDDNTHQEAEIQRAEPSVQRLPGDTSDSSLDATESRTPPLNLGDTADNEEEAKLSSIVEEILSGVMHSRLPADENMRPLEWKFQSIGSRGMLKNMDDLDLMADFDSTVFTGTGLEKKTIDEVERIVRSALWMQDSVAVLTYLLQQHGGGIASIMAKNAQTRSPLFEEDIIRLKKFASEGEDHASLERLEMEKKEAELQKYSELLRQLLRKSSFKEETERIRREKWSRSASDQPFGRHLVPPKIDAGDGHTRNPRGVLENDSPEPRRRGLLDDIFDRQFSVSSGAVAAPHPLREKKVPQDVTFPQKGAGSSSDVDPPPISGDLQKLVRVESSGTKSDEKPKPPDKKAESHLLSVPPVPEW